MACRSAMAVRRRSTRRSRSAGTRCASRAPARSTSPRPPADHEARPRRATTSRSPTATVRGLRDRPTVLKRWKRRDRRRGLLPEARAREAPGVAADRDRALPVGPQRDRARAQRRRAPGLGASTSATSTGTRGRCAAATSTIPTSCASTSTRSPASSGARCARSRCAPATCSRARAASASRRRSGSRGIHVNVRIEPRWDFTEVRRAALALAREVERRMPGRATSQWWKEERDRRLPRLQPERPRPHGRLAVLGAPGARRAGVAARCAGTRSPTSSPSDLRLDTVPARLREVGDPSARRSTTSTDSLDALLDLARRDEEEGLGDAPWPPHFAKQAGEPKRVQPSRARGED